MIFSCTAKAKKKLIKYHEFTTEKFEVGLSNWYVNLVRVDKHNFFLCTNSLTYLSFVALGADADNCKNFHYKFIQMIGDYFMNNVCRDKELFVEIMGLNQPPVFTSTNSASVLGVMNDYRHLLEHTYYRQEYLEDVVDEANRLFKENISAKIDYRYPIEAFKKEVNKYTKNRPIVSPFM